MSAIPVYPTTDDGFARARERLGFDDPGWCAPRRAPVLAALEAAYRLEPGQVRAMLRAQHDNLLVREQGRAVSLGGEARDALGCLREEARRHGRLVALGQAWAGSNQLIALITTRHPAIVRQALATVVSGEVLCRVLDDLTDRRVFGPDEEDLLRRAWRAAHPVPAYFRRFAVG
ncbi:hypothetical protein OM076_43785 [Solirubrobacter ginsenosidimutans]|uniref:Uncharacterized protein n=1 Tax=Solirubrobacter ginsenosidimutans TaxID=490573 RepID=A0A9X3N2V4_9ACTN|nr:hypothetical protein [Solirubrobacter ginsenosidimutans]MDA0167262.1 hypothetical protein [Solirubrobacter ginsenosidimutans]